MPTPLFQDAGAGDYTNFGNTHTVNYPATVAAGDLLVLQLYGIKITGFSSGLSGWTSIQTGTTASGPGFHDVLAKVAAGTEGGTTFTVVAIGLGNYGIASRVYRFKQTAPTSYTEGAAAANSAGSTTVSDTGVTTSATNRLALNFVALHVAESISAFTGMTGGTWAEATAEYTGTNITLQLQSATIASAGTINGGTTTVGTSTEWSVIGFALKPPPAILMGLPAEADSALSMTAVKTPTGLHHAQGLTSETDTALAMTAYKTPPADALLKFAIDFGNGFEDITERVRSLTMTHGRPFNMDVIEAGTLSAVLANGDGALDPSTFTSPWYGRVIPLLPVRMLRFKDGNTYELFQGPIERWLPQWAPPYYQDMNIEVSDAFETLSEFTLVSGYSTMTTALGGSNKDLTFTAVDAGENGDLITVTYVVAGTGTSEDSSTNTPVQGNSTFAVKGRANLSGSWSPAPAPAVGTSTALPALTVAVSGTDITITCATDGSGNCTSTASSIKATMAANPDIAKLVTVSYPAGNNGSGVVTAMTQTPLVGGQWPQELSGTRINRVLDLAGWSTGLRAVDAGSSVVAMKGFALADNVSALAHIQEIADSELGYCFMTGGNVFTYHDGNHRTVAPRSLSPQATFSDDGTAFSYQTIDPSFDKDRIVNEAAVTSAIPNAVPQTADDTYSQSGVGAAPTNATAIPPNGFGKRAITRTTQLAYDSDALTQAEAIVAAFAYPKYRFDAISTLEPSTGTSMSTLYESGLYGAGGYGVESSAADSAWVQAVLGLEIGDLVTLLTTPPATNTTTSYNAFVESIQDDLAPGQPWRRTLKLSPSSQTISGGGGGGGGGGTPGAMLNDHGNVLILDDPTEGTIV